MNNGCEPYAGSLHSGPRRAAEAASRASWALLSLAAEVAALSKGVFSCL
jgi:hypothetical protein